MAKKPCGKIQKLNGLWKERAANYLFSRTYVRVRVLKRPRKLSHVIEENAGGQLNNMGLKVNSMEKVLGIQSQGLYFQRHFVIKLTEIWTFLTMFLFPETFSP